jgi:TonB family protein
MRKLFIAGLMLSPMLLTSAAVARSPKSDAAVATQNLRVSTGVTAPAIVNPADIHIAASEADRTLPAGANVVLALNVDEKGVAHNVRVVKSVNPDLDARVIAAVSQSHFRPATLDNQTIAFDLNLIVNVQR